MAENFDLRTHIVDGTTGQIKTHQPYRIVGDGTGQVFIRGGKKFSAANDFLGHEHPQKEEAAPKQKGLTAMISEFVHSRAEKEVEKPDECDDKDKSKEEVDCPDEVPVEKPQAKRPPGRPSKFNEPQLGVRE